MTLRPESEKAFGYVIAQFIKNVADGSDGNELPDYIAQTGTITFDPVETLTITENPHAYLTRSRVTASLSSDTGKIQNPGSPKQDGVWLAVGYWHVSFGISTSPAIAPVTIEVTEDHTIETPLDLVNYIPETPTQYKTVNQVTLPSGGVPGRVLVLGVDGLAWSPASLDSVAQVENMSAAVTAPRRIVEWQNTVDLPEFGGFLEVTLIGNTVLNLPPRGSYAEIYNLLIKQDSIGKRTLSIPTAKTAFGVLYTVSTAPGATDFISLMWTGAEWLCMPGALQLKVPA